MQNVRTPATQATVSGTVQQPCPAIALQSRVEETHEVLNIREYRDDDLPALEALAAEIQDYERQFDSNLRPGPAMAQEYAAELLGVCKKYRGRILIADLDDAVAGLIAFRTVKLIENEHPHMYISDLVVFTRYRQRGVGRALLDAAADHARQAGISRISLMVYADNRVARDVYERSGFETHALEMVRILTPS